MLFRSLFRTFAPFVAGIGAMSYPKFALFNLVGAASWVFSLCLAGYWLGNMPWVKQNLSVLILGIIALVRYQRRRAERVAAEDKPLSADEASRADALLKELDNK